MAAYILGMAPTTTAQPRLGNGTFTYDPKAPDALSSSDFESTSTEAEAFGLYSDMYPGVSRDAFERKLFDTYATEAEYESDVQDADSELRILSNKLTVHDLPSGGIAVFFD